MAKKIIKGVGKIAKGVLGGSLLGGVVGKALFGKKKAGSAAADTGPTTMPLPDDEKIKAARKRAIAAQMQRGGRSSTILTDGTGGTLGG